MATHDGLIDPPNTLTVHSEDRPLLYRADGTPLKRQIGFAMQTRGTNPALYQGKGGKKSKGGKKGC